MELRIVHLYPDLMSLYGSYANVAVLKKTLETAGFSVVLDRVPLGGEVDFDGADFVFMGAGTERAQKAALEAFRRFAPDLKRAAEDGVSMLFAGTAMELLGEKITDREGKEWSGLSLSGFTSIQGEKRIVGDVYGKTDLAEGAVVGFMNKSAIITGVETPLLTALDMGFGNEKIGGAEGFVYQNLLASELTGPLLVKNPHLLTRVCRAILDRRGADAEIVLDDYLTAAYAVTEEALRARCGT